MGQKEKQATHPSVPRRSVDQRRMTLPSRSGICPAQRRPKLLRFLRTISTETTVKAYSIEQTGSPRTAKIVISCIIYSTTPTFSIYSNGIFSFVVGNKRGSG